MTSMPSRPNIRIGKLSTKSPAFPSEANYIASMRQQCKELETILFDFMQDMVDNSTPIMIRALTPTFDLSQLYCPVDTGALKASGYLETTSFRGNPRVEMGYARGGNPSYAVVVHEDPQFYHKPPTRYKWLQAAMMEDLGNIYDRLGIEYRGAAGL